MFAKLVLIGATSFFLPSFAAAQCTGTLRSMTQLDSCITQPTQQQITFEATLKDKPEGAADGKSNTDTKPSVAGEYKDFISTKFGVAVGFEHGLGAPRVDSASIVNGVVRVDQGQRDRPMIALEAHHFLFLDQDSNNLVPGNRFFGFGPFASIQASTDSSSISSFGLGIMFGWSDPATGKTLPTDGSLSSWNLGIGVMIDGSVKHLGDGLIANAATQETQVRYKTTSGRSLFAMVSRTF